METFAPEWNRELVTFIAEANEHTYASTESKKRAKPYRPGCEEYMYENGDWMYLDSYAWNKDGGGEEIIYFRGTPVWMMNYYGFLVGANAPKTIYSFLKEALRKQHPDLPVRGSHHEDKEKGLRYEIEFNNNEIGNFSGIEKIYFFKETVYECYVHGGFIK